MASFPGGLDSFTVKVNNVDDVLASHINEVQDAIESLELKMGITNSTDSVNWNVDYFLRSASGAFRNHIHDGTSDDGAQLSLSTSFSDIQISSLSNNQMLKYNSSSGKWENATISYTLNDLSDVTISGAATRQGIYYSGGYWYNGYPNAVYAS